MRAWVAYAVVALVIAGVGAGVAAVVGPVAVAKGIGISAGLAWLVQVAAFGFLVRVRGQPTLFLAAFVSGVALRFAVVGGVALWVTRTEAYPAAPTLVGLVAFVFAMLLLEPVFLRKGLPSA